MDNLTGTISKYFKQYCYEAGRIIEDYKGNHTVSAKYDNSPITEVDVKVSALGKEFFSNSFFLDRHITYCDEEIIDSEIKINGNASLELETFKQKKIILADPLGGTKAFIANLPFYGTYISYIDGGVPLLGMVYLPMLRELYYNDSDNAYLVHNPFTDNEHEVILTSPTLDYEKIVFVTSCFKEEAIGKLPKNVTNLYGLGTALTWPLAGKGDGAVFKAKLWDITAQWAIAKKAGAYYAYLDTAEEIVEINVSDFTANYMMDNFWWILKR